MGDDDADDRHQATQARAALADPKITAPVYRRDGTRIRVVEEWERLLTDDDYRGVAVDQVGERRVSTVWLGLDHNYGVGAPLIFETIVFGPDDGTQYCRRYATEREAQASHATLVAFLRAGGDLAAYDDREG